MKNQNVIQLSQYRQQESFDFSAYNRRAEIRLRNSERRARISSLIENCVTATIGLCSVFCLYLAFTML